MISLSAVKAAATSAAGAAQLAVKANSPQLLFAAGVVGVVGTVVLASKATLKVSPTLDEFDENKAKAKKLHAERPEAYSEKDLKKDMLVLQTNLVLDFTKMYGPAVCLGVLSIAALGGSHYILTKRNAALTTTLAGVQKAFDKYRERVVADQGEDKDHEYMYGKIEKEVYAGETKKGKPIIETQGRHDGKPLSIYAKIFDQSNLNFQSTLKYNLYFLRLVQCQLNDRLQARGHVVLNEVYRELGMEDTEPGAVVGWVLGDEGDDFIDFGIWSDRDLEEAKPHMLGENGALLLDFNVNGPIYKKLGRSKR
jgi:hypothetical protein